MRNVLLGVWMVLGLVVATGAEAQGISVVVDGKPLAFQGAGAQRLNGRVMVPMRGTFEALGATVEWLPATRTAVAKKGDVNLELTIGERIAKLNGKDVLLDVPATVLKGSTMVPLRFIGEALIADLVWDSRTRTVRISSLPPDFETGRNKCWEPALLRGRDRPD